MLPSKGHEANQTELFQAVMQGVRKWQPPGRRAQGMIKKTFRDAQIAVSKAVGYALTLQRFVAGTKPPSSKQVKARGRGKR